MLKRILRITSIITLFLMATPVLAQPLTLWEYYQEAGLNLPSIEGRAVTYAEIDNTEFYRGTAEQNEALLDFLLNGLTKEDLKFDIEEDDGFFGGAGGSSELPQVSADFESSLVSKIVPSDTTMSLVDSTDRDGNTLSGWYGFTIEINSSKRETVIANCAGSSCSGLLRGVSYSDGISTSSDRIFTHGRGSDVSITNHPNLVILTNIMNGTDGIPDKIYYDSGITLTAGDNIKTLADIEYVNGLIANGVATSTKYVFGGGKLSTRDQARTGYFDVDDPRFLSSEIASSSNDVATSSVLTTKANGYINLNQIDLTEDRIYTGNITNSGDTSMASTTFTASTTYDILPEYDFDPIGDDEAVRKSYSDQNISSYSMGVGTKNNSTAEQTIAHGLSGTPTRIRLRALSSNGDRTLYSSTGMYDGSSYATLYFEDVNPNVIGTDTSNIAFLKQGSNYMKATSTLDSTNITLGWTETSNYPVTITYIWEAWIN